MELALFKLVVKVPMAGKAMNSIVSTSSKEPKEAEVKMVSCSKCRPVTFFKESALKLLKSVALKIVKEPWISSTEAKAAFCRESPEIVKFPTRVEQPDSLFRSDCAVAVVESEMVHEDGMLEVELAAKIKDAS